MKRKSFSQYSPLFYFIAVWVRRIQRYYDWYLGRKKYSKKRTGERLPFRIKKHQSVLIRKLAETEMQWQYNKITNLKIAVSKINGIIIRPGEVFSFCKLVGRPTRKKGFREGMELSFGKARPGIGGGLCQLSNLIHWLVIHSPLSVTERHHHSFDPFPDDGRILPFGSGATVFYNYRDFQFANHTPWTFQLNFWFTEKCIEGELRVNEELDFCYHVYEKEHRFLNKNEKYYRQNEIWRKKILKFKAGKEISDELVVKNFAEVKYIPDF
ncbi:MAG: VanW family protein [Bacteroidota bacterium]